MSHPLPVTWHTEDDPNREGVDLREGDQWFGSHGLLVWRDGQWVTP